MLIKKNNYGKFNEENKHSNEIEYRCKNGLILNEVVWRYKLLYLQMLEVRHFGQIYSVWGWGRGLNLKTKKEAYSWM